MWWNWHDDISHDHNNTSTLIVALHAMHKPLHTINGKWFHFKYVMLNWVEIKNQISLKMQLTLFSLDLLLIVTNC
jgi:hypothetical protein